VIEGQTWQMHHVVSPRLENVIGLGLRVGVVLYVNVNSIANYA